MISITLATTRLLDLANPAGRGVCAAVAPRGRTTLCARSDRATAAAAAPPIPLCAAYIRSCCSAAAGPRFVPAESPLTTGEGHDGGCAGPIY